MKLAYGFTLIELMIVVSVIGVITIIGVPAYKDYIRYSDTSVCAQYIMAARLNATNVIVSDNGSLDGVNEGSLGLTNNNNECSGGITVSISEEALSIQGRIGSEASMRVFTMSRATNGVWSCQTTDDGGETLYSDNCVKFGN